MTPDVKKLLKNDEMRNWFLLMLFGGVLAMLRSLPEKAWKKSVDQFSVTATLDSGDKAYTWLSKWFSEQPYGESARAVSVYTEGGAYYDDDMDKTVFKPYRINFIPSLGTHLFAYKGKLVWLTYGKKDQADLATRQVEKWITLKTLGRSTNLLRELIQEASNQAQQEEFRVDIHTSRGDWWTVANRQKPRNLESVILDEGVVSSIVADISQFLGSEEWYRQKGIPHRRGYLFYGIPGSGKTSLITALAGNFQLPIYIISFHAKELNDASLLSLISSVKERSIVLMEDIDAVFEGRDSNSGVTFSGLLNAIDGVTGSDGRLLFMTTNHVDKLDTALIRPGRIDYQLEFQFATKEQARRLFLHFFPEANASQAKRFAHTASSVATSMAALQNHLLIYRNDPEKAVKECPH